MAAAAEGEPLDRLSGSSTAFNDSKVFGGVGRTATFWRRASRIYFGYKNAQARAAWLGHPPKNIKDEFWNKHHTWAGAEMYSLAIDLRGFYLKVTLNSTATSSSCASAQ